MVFSGLTSIFGQQLIEVESLADIDPAIFTAVRNYFYENVAIRMPPDQTFADDDEIKKQKALPEESLN